MIRFRLFILLFGILQIMKQVDIFIEFVICVLMVNLDFVKDLFVSIIVVKFDLNILVIYDI